MAASITEITRIQRLIKEFQDMANTHFQARDFLQQIEKEYNGSTLLSLEALQGLDTERQQALASLIESLVDKMHSSQPFSAEEEKKLAEIIQHANVKQRAVNLKQPEEKQAGLDSIGSGHCSLISLKMFGFLEPKRQEQLAILVGRNLLQEKLSEKDQKSMANLVQLAHLKQETAIAGLNVSSLPITSAPSSVFFPTAPLAKIGEGPGTSLDTTHSQPKNN